MIGTGIACAHKARAAERGDTPLQVAQRFILDQAGAEPCKRYLTGEKPDRVIGKGSGSGSEKERDRVGAILLLRRIWAASCGATPHLEGSARPARAGPLAHLELAGQGCPVRRGGADRAGALTGFNWKRSGRCALHVEPCPAVGLHGLLTGRKCSTVGAVNYHQEFDDIPNNGPNVTYA